MTAVSVVAIVHGQQEGAGAMRSVRDGVYTDAQATRGERLFLARCTECHGAQVWRDVWQTRMLSELFTSVQTRMPEDDPGTLTSQQTADALAYILKAAGLPRGRDELSIDLAVLKLIRIEPAAP